MNAKRCFDVLVSLSLLLLLAPVIGILVVAVRALLGRPIFFRQLRPGLGGKCFKLIKFRTLTEDCDSDGQPLPDAQRLHPFGNWLRRHSLDELPELINVLRGDMSLVGPRPLLVEYLERYTAKQARRHEVLPGITGWAQIHGRNAISWEEKFTLDVWYVDNSSFWLDMWILVLTLIHGLNCDGVTAPGKATATKFLGTSAKKQHDSVMDDDALTHTPTNTEYQK